MPRAFFAVKRIANDLRISTGTTKLAGFFFGVFDKPGEFVATKVT